MSHQNLQRVVVRMLHDVRFAESVFESPKSTLSGLELTDTERAWIASSDARAYRTDPHRGARVLTAIIEEFALTSALLARASGSIQVLHDYISSPEFHRAIQQRESVALAFGSYVDGGSADEAHGGRTSRHIAQIEYAIATLRRIRTLPPAPGGGIYQLCSTTRLLQLPSGTVDYFESLRAHLAGYPGGLVAAAIHVDFPIPKIPGALRRPSQEFEGALIDLAANAVGPTIEVLPPALAAILIGLGDGLDEAAFVAMAQSKGADNADEARALLADLVSDGLLIRGSPCVT